MSRVWSEPTFTAAILGRNRSRWSACAHQFTYLVRGAGEIVSPPPERAVAHGVQTDVHQVSPAPSQPQFGGTLTAVSHHETPCVGQRARPGYPDIMSRAPEQLPASYYRDRTSAAPARYAV